MQQLVGGYIEAVKLNPVIVHKTFDIAGWLLMKESFYPYQ